jgi:hypothetical protein
MGGIHVDPDLAIATVWVTTTAAVAAVADAVVAILSVTLVRIQDIIINLFGHKIRNFNSSWYSFSEK